MKKILSFMLMGLVSISLFTGCNKATSESNNNEETINQTGDSGVVTKPMENESTSNFDASKVINVISREAGSGTRGAFIELLGIEVKQEDGTKTDLTTEEAIIVNKTDVMMTNIAGDLYSIGYISLGSLNDTVKPIMVDGVEASKENVKNGSYTIARPFNIATKGEPTGLAKDFIDFILSAEGQSIVSESYIEIDENAVAYSGDKPSGKIVVSGSSSVTPVMEKLQEAYLAINPNATIEIQMTDSTAGMTAAIDGTCDIGMASRDLKDSELENLKGIEIALDGISIIVNEENPISDLSKDTIRAVFTGEAGIWDEVHE